MHVRWSDCSKSQYSEARLEYWLRMIRSRADKAPIVLVGTHADNKVRDFADAGFLALSSVCHTAFVMLPTSLLPFLQACTEQFLKDVHSYIALFLANRHPQVCSPLVRFMFVSIIIKSLNCFGMILFTFL